MQGERELVKDNRSLARFKLKGIPPLPAGVPKVEVEFVIDANGTLNVHAAELRTGTVATVSVNPSYGLTSEQVESSLRQAWEHAETDFEARFLGEARTEANTVILATRKSLNAGCSLLESTEEAVIRRALSELEEAVQGSDWKKIREKTEALHQVTKEFAKRLLNHSLEQALKDKSIENIAGDKSVETHQSRKIVP
jgi:molecular chaperone DnaK (HSP70)